jgi:hypothetical protein
MLHRYWTSAICKHWQNILTQTLGLPCGIRAERKTFCIGNSFHERSTEPGRLQACKAHCNAIAQPTTVHPRRRFKYRILSCLGCR